MKFIPPKYTGIIMASVMSFIMSGVISLTFALLAHGLAIEVVALWPMSWLKAWVVALPAAILIMPLVRKWVMAHTRM